MDLFLQAVYLAPLQLGVFIFISPFTLKLIVAFSLYKHVHFLALLQWLLPVLAAEEGLIVPDFARLFCSLCFAY